MSGEKPLINIGTEKSCLFVHLSKQLINILERNQFLHPAVEESLKCATEGYYAAGILAYSQIFNCFGIAAPEARHKVAHEFLQHQPTKETYDSLLETIKYVTEIAYTREADKFNGTREAFHQTLLSTWEKYMVTRENLKSIQSRNSDK
jgi:hypothetical protein